MPSGFDEKLRHAPPKGALEPVMSALPRGAGWIAAPESVARGEASIFPRLRRHVDHVCLPALPSRSRDCGWAGVPQALEITVPKVPSSYSLLAR
jgi:hypothetical protein